MKLVAEPLAKTFNSHGSFVAWDFSGHSKPETYTFCLDSSYGCSTGSSALQHELVGMSARDCPTQSMRSTLPFVYSGSEK